VDELGDVDAIDAEAAEGVLDLEAEEPRAEIADFDHDGRDEGTGFVEGAAEDEKGEPAVVGGAGVEPDPGVHGKTGGGDIAFEEILAAAEGHAAEGEGGECGHGWNPRTSRGLNYLFFSARATAAAWFVIAAFEAPEHDRGRENDESDKEGVEQRAHGVIQWLRS
jgi:hypothetical protein